MTANAITPKTTVILIPFKKLIQSMVGVQPPLNSLISVLTIRIKSFYRIVNILFPMKARNDSFTVAQKYALLQNQLTNEQRIVKVQLYYPHHGNLANLSLSLNLSNLERILNHSQVFYMDPSAKICQFLGVFPFSDDIFVEVDQKSKAKLHFKFRKIGSPMPKISLPEVKEPIQPTIRKSGERTIGEVRQYLEQKNQIYRNLAQSGQNCTLQQAADLIGLPKKTLDDYERHIRLADAYGFDFEINRHMGMGVLRNFVKTHSKESPQPVQPIQAVQPKQEFIDPGLFLNTSTHSKF